MNITVIGVPYQMDVARWGYALGPQAFLDHGLLERLERMGHHAHAPIWIELPASERTRDSVTNLGNLARRTAAAVSAALRQDDSFVLALEGDCTHAVGAIGGLARAAETPGVVWFDAHGDLNTRATSTSGYWGGMPYAVALGWDLDDWRLAAGLEQPVRPEAAALIGTSDLDPEEQEALQQQPILHLTAGGLVGADAAERVEQALRSRAREAAAWYLHLDLDVAGPEVVPGGMTPAPAWASRAQLIAAARASARAVPVRVLALATYNPSADAAGKGVEFGLDMAVAVMEGLQ